MNKFIHPLSDVQSHNIGDNTQIWQYAVVLKGARIGANCNINCHTFIENDVEVGNYVTVKAGVYLWDGLRIKDRVFIGPNVTFTNDKYPRSKQKPDSFQTTVIEFGVSIGAGAVILGGVRIGKYAVIAAGSVVTRDVLSHSLMVGSPAKRVKWVDSEGLPMTDSDGRCFISKSGETYELINGVMKLRNKQ